MVSINRYTSISQLVGLFTVLTATNIWTGVNAQEFPDEETNEEEGDPSVTTTGDEQWADPPTSTEYYESETTYIDDTTTAIDEFETTTADPLITPSSTFPMEPIPTTDVYSTEEAIPSITDDISSTVPTPSNSISTTSAVPTTNPETSTNVGAIAGGVVGGVAGVALIGAIVFLLLRRRKAKSAADREVFRPENDEEYAPPAQHSQPSWQNSEAGNYPPMSSAAPPPPRHSYVAPNREAY